MAKVADARTVVIPEGGHQVISEHLMFVESAREARGEVDKALALLALERPELRYEMYKKVTGSVRAVIGLMFTVDEVKERFKELPETARAFAGIINFLKANAGDNLVGLHFRPADVTDSRFARGMNFGNHVLELKHLGIIGKSSGPVVHQRALHLTERGQELAVELGHLKSSAH